MKAMVLAAGFGKRLGELTKDTPKCLMDIDGKTILEIVVGHLRESGVTKLAINTHYLAQKVEDYVKNAPVFKGLDVTIFREEQILGTGGALKNAASFLAADEEPFIVHNSDIYEDFDLAALIQKHKQSKALVTFLAVDRKTDSCLIGSDDNRYLGVWNIKEKGDAPKHSLLHTFTGVHIASPKILKYMADFSGEFSVFKPYDLAAASSEKLLIEHLCGVTHVDMGTVTDLEYLRNLLKY